MVEQYSHQNGEHIQAAMDKLEKRIKVVNRWGQDTRIQVSLPPFFLMRNRQFFDAAQLADVWLQIEAEAQRL